MIAGLTGKVKEILVNVVTLDVHGVGYEVHCSRRCLESLNVGAEAELVVYTDVREDSIKLYGFSDRVEKQVFLLLTTVSGVGPKSASEIISQIDKRELLHCIAAEDVSRLQAVKGVGKKTSERIIVELKDKIATLAQEGGAPGLRLEKNVIGPAQDAVEALIALGFSRKDAERAVNNVEQRTADAPKDSSALVKEALRYV